MSKISKLIKISGLLEVIVALVSWQSLSLYSWLSLCLGIILLSFSFLTDEELAKKRIYILIWAIISLFLNIVSAVMLFIVVDELSSFKQKNMIFKEELITSESKRIDILLKVGLGMILISGILFTTSSWEVIPNIVKCFGLLGIGCLFIWLSKFSEKKLKIEKTTKAYYVIGLCFFQLTMIGIGFYGVFSEWFSYTGEGKYLVCSLTLFLLSGLLNIINDRFNERQYKYMALFTVVISIYYLLLFIGLNIEIIMLVISTGLLLLNILLENKKYKIFSEVSQLVSYSYWPILLVYGEIDIVIIVSSLITIINMMYLVFNKKEQSLNVLAIIISYILTIEIISLIRFGDMYVVTFISATIFYNILNHNKVKFIINTNQVVYNIIATILLISLDSSLKIFFCSIIYGIVNVINCYITNKNNSKFDLYYQPVVLFMVVSGCLNILGDVINFNNIYYFIIPTVLYVVVNYIMKEQRIRKIYYIYLIIGIILTMIVNMFINDVIVGIVLVLIALYLFKSRRNGLIWLYSLFLITILALKDVILENVDYGILFNFLNILVFGGLTYLYKDNIILRKINLIVIIIPLYSLVQYLGFDDQLKSIVSNLLSLYILFTIVTQFINDYKTRDLIATIFTVLILCQVMFIDSLLVGLYIGLIGIIMMIITYNHKSYKLLFYCGIVVTILNILIKLRDFWSKIPLSLYLLIAGGALIAFVTNKELKNKDKEKTNEGMQFQEKKLYQEDKTKKKTDDSMIELINFCPLCGNKNTGYKFCPKCGSSLIKR